MKIYKDVFSGDEMVSDSYPISVVDDIVYEVQGKMITKGDVAIDIGANPSAEDGPSESYDSEKQTVCNVVDAHQLQESGFDKKGFLAWVKTYMKRIKTHLEKENPERVETFQKAAQGFVKQMVGKFDDYQFFMGSSMDSEAGLGFMFYKEDGMTPYFYFFKDGLIEEKV